MKWNMIVAKAIKDGTSAKVIHDTVDEMQKLLDFAMSIEPELYWDFKSSVLSAVNGSANDEYGIDNDSCICIT